MIGAAGIIPAVAPKGEAAHVARRAGRAGLATFLSRVTGLARDPVMPVLSGAGAILDDLVTGMPRRLLAR